MPEQTPDLLHRITAATAALAGNTFLRRLVRELVEQLPVTHAFVARVDDEPRRGARVLAWSRAAGEQRGALARTAGAPATFLGDDTAENARGLRASCSIFAAADIEHAFAVELIDADGMHVGHLGVTDPAPGTPDEEQLAVLGLCAARAAAEIRRQRSERSSRALGEEQAALLRIATLVTQAAPPERLLRSVTTEAGLLYDGETARTLHYEDAAAARVMGCWSEDGVLKVGLGDQVLLADDPAAAEVLRTGVAARLDGDGSGRGSAIAAPVVVEGRLWGAITVSRTADRPFRGTAERRLGRLAEIFAQAIANLEAREQLAASRARLVEAADRERRRLERNLHDGAQQRLVTLALTLRLAESRLAQDPAAAALVREASVELAGALEELRELARGIHPAVLTNRGLVPAVESLLERTPLAVTLEAAVDERLPEPVEVGAYYVVAESLTNVTKYAGAAAATVRLGREEGALRVEVEDDGAGGADAARGSGLAGLADRVEALGGRLDVRSPPGEGTLVRAEIPSRRP